MGRGLSLVGTAVSVPAARGGCNCGSLTATYRANKAAPDGQLFFDQPEAR
ncbi:MAG: hypothetical protein KAT39_13870 [Alphaproteobacteria bacterium]|nr:hypothetical protein [Alphaproteobacteria bacterium]